MKKHIFIYTTIVVSISLGYSSELKGSDYILTQTGTTYTYQRIDAGDNDIFLIETTIKNCNNDKTLCKYVSKIKDPSNKKIDGSESDYAYHIKENGAVYIKYPKSKKETLLLPANIKLSKVRSDNGSNANGEFTNSYEFTKQIPEINVNGTNYKNCIELNANSNMKIKKQTIKTQSQEVYCKDIGLVKEIFEETHGSSSPTVYKSILSSVKKS
ncbi:hypothetical protein fh0823_21490 [Francisella halioticida]|uniref:Uncharacterized protein n=1 Tax=Francisella halioticida TaxID=549298 RepID=A0ABN5AW08_9GAMM|nr:hypothetical protein [Francisella halioticida]ASG67056.1 hypothetical protein CDV26_00435 [Francisella halioticida]BCD92010.1 hypothetical protein fh0823_21490 [Francisella halioticida]